MSLGEYLKGKRKALGMTQPDVATLAGVTPRTWQRWERSERAWTLGLWRRAAAAVGHTAEEADGVFRRIEMGSSE